MSTSLTPPLDTSLPTLTLPRPTKLRGQTETTHLLSKEDQEAGVVAVVVEVVMDHP